LATLDSCVGRQQHAGRAGGGSARGGQDFALFVADLNGEIRTTSSFSEILFESNFDDTPDGDPPSTTQLVGTAQVEGSVIVVDPPFPHTDKWLQINRPIGPQNPNSSFFCVLTAIKDRMERSGMRWTETIAEAILQLRAVHLSSDFDSYWSFHIEKDQQRIHPPGQWSVVLK